MQTQVEQKWKICYEQRNIVLGGKCNEIIVFFYTFPLCRPAFPQLYKPKLECTSQVQVFCFQHLTLSTSKNTSAGWFQHLLASDVSVLHNICVVFSP